MKQLNDFNRMKMHRISLSNFFVLFGGEREACRIGRGRGGGTSREEPDPRNREHGQGVTGTDSVRPQVTDTVRVKLGQYYSLFK